MISPGSNKLIYRYVPDMMGQLFSLHTIHSVGSLSWRPHCLICTKNICWFMYQCGLCQLCNCSQVSQKERTCSLATRQTAVSFIYSFSVTTMLGSGQLFCCFNPTNSTGSFFFHSTNRTSFPLNLVKVSAASACSAISSGINKCFWFWFSK